MLIVVALMGQVLGFLRNRLISTNFTVFDPGTSDAFFAAFQIPDFFFYTIAAGALGVAFMPFLSDRLENGDKKSVWELASSLTNLMVVVMGVVAVIIFLFASPIMHLIAPNLPKENLDQAITIMRLIALNPLMFTISGILTSTQQTFGRFFFYAIAPLTYNLSIIISIFVFRDNIGIVGLGVGAMVGGLVQLLVAALGLFGLGVKYHPIINFKNANFRSMLRQIPPRSLDQGIDQVNSIVEVNRAQALGVGPVSFYAYALTLMHVPVYLIGHSIATASYPRLVARLSQNRRDLFRKDFLSILRVMIWIAAPVVVVSYFGRGYLARMIFGDVAPDVALIFGFLMAAIFFRIIYALMSRWFYAQKDTKTPLFVSVFAIALNIYLAFTLAKPESYDIAGLALAHSIATAAEVVILTTIMIIRDRKMFDWTFVSALTRIISVTGFAMVASYLTVQAFPLQLTDRGIVTLGSKFGLIAAVTLGVYTLVSWAFGMREAKSVIQKAKAVIFKPIKFS